MEDSGKQIPRRDSSSAHRQEFLSDLDEYRSSSEESFNGILARLGWTKQTLQGDDMVLCPVDSRHWVPESSFSKHTEACQWSQEGYTKEDYVSAPTSSFFYENHGSVFAMKLDQATLNEILSRVNGKPTFKLVPRTAERACTDFTQAEKLAIYDHVVAQGQRSRSSSSRLIEEIGVDAETSGTSKILSARPGQKKLSRVELLKQMRDYKRRRQSYRAKNVHITKRSQTDILREIIANQMEDAEAEWRALRQEGTDDDDNVRREKNTTLEQSTSFEETVSSIRKYRQESGPVTNQSESSLGNAGDDLHRGDLEFERDRIERDRCDRSEGKEGENGVKRESSPDLGGGVPGESPKDDSEWRRGPGQEMQRDTSTPPSRVRSKKHKHHHSKKHKRHKQRRSKERT